MKALDENKDNTTRKSKGKVTAIAHGGKSSSVNTSTTRDRPRLVGLFRSRITSNSIFGRKLRERSAGRGGSVKNYFWQFHGAIKPLVVLLLPFIRTCLSELTGTIVQKPFQNQAVCVCVCVCVCVLTTSARGWYGNSILYVGNLFVLNTV